MSQIVHLPVFDRAPFAVGLFRFTLSPQQPLFVPAINKTNMLRGAFGTSFRRLCCVSQCQDARRCPLAAACPYKQIFEPSPPAGSDRLSKSQDVPRPFIFRAPETAQTRFVPGEEFRFELVLIGRALEFLPYFVLSFRELAAQGMGLNRAKCELRRVDEVMALPSAPGNELMAQDPAGTNRLIFDSSDQVFHAPEGTGLEKWLKLRLSQPGWSDACGTGVSGLSRIEVRFLTPTLLKSEGSVIRQPDFHHLIKRLRDRINALSTFFGSGPLEIDFAGLGARAEQVRTISSDVQWIERFRTSSKTRQRHELSGFTGSAVYEGQLYEFLLWLALGELVHVGKHTAWGMGRVCAGNLKSGSAMTAG